MSDAVIIATRPNGAMRPLDNNAKGSGVEMIEHDDGAGGGGGNCGMSSEVTPLWEHARQYHVR